MKVKAINGNTWMLLAITFLGCTLLISIINMLKITKNIMNLLLGKKNMHVAYVINNKSLITLIFVTILLLIFG